MMNFVSILEFLKKSLEGRGTYPVFMVIFSWTIVFVLALAVIFQLLLYIFKVKYDNSEFEAAVNKEINEKEKME